MKIVIDQEMENQFQGIATFLATALFIFGQKFPTLSARKGISTLITVILIVVIIVAGATIIFVLVITPGPSTSTYP